VRRSSLARSSSAFVAGAFLQRVVPFLMLPILTRYLTPAEFGVATMFLVAVNVIDPVMGLSSTSAVSRQYFERDRIDFPTYVGNCLYLFAGTVAFTALAIPIAGVRLSTMLSIPPRWMWAALSVSAGKYLITLTLTLWQVQKRPRPYVIFSVSQATATFAFALGLIIAFGLGWRGRVIGEVMSVTAFAFGAILLLRASRVQLVVNRAYLHHAAAFGLGIVPHLYGSLMLAASDRVLLAKLTTVDIVGEYAVGAQIAQILAVLVSAFNLAWMPWYFERLKSDLPEDRARIRTVTRVYSVGVIAAAFVLTLVAKVFLAVIVGPKFHGSEQYVLWLSLGAAFGGMYTMAVNRIFYSGKTYLIPVATLSSGAVGLGLNYVLIRRLGPIGSAMSNAIAMFLCYLITLGLARTIRTRRGADPGVASTAASSVALAQDA
jgi:O-antigen/teichoic acid export membrane protein